MHVCCIISCTLLFYFHQWCWEIFKLHNIILFFTSDVEKSLDPSKEQKRRPMSVESIDITADDDDESVDMDHVGDPERYGVYCGFNFFFFYLF